MQKNNYLPVNLLDIYNKKIEVVIDENHYLCFLYN